MRQRSRSELASGRMAGQENSAYRAVLPAALALRQRSLAIAARRARTAGLLLMRDFFPEPVVSDPLILAHLALAPADILALAAALILLLPGLV